MLESQLNQTVTSVVLSRNQIGDKGCVALADALKVCGVIVGEFVEGGSEMRDRSTGRLRFSISQGMD